MSPSGRVLALGLALGALLLAPHFMLAPEPDRPAMNAVGFITSTWHPTGHDDPARLAARLEADEGSTPEQWRELADLYFEMGRDREARRVIARTNRRFRRR